VVDAVVVGAGPNGLAAAVVLARAGLSVEVLERADTVGGGARTREVTLPGFRHDTGSAVHPMALASPFFRAFDLAAHGVRLAQPEIAYGHPLDGGRAALAHRDLDATAAGLGRDGRAWRSLFAPLVRDWSDVVGVALGDMRSVAPRALPAAARLGAAVLEQASPAWNLRFGTPEAAALLTGVAAHTIAPPRAFGPAGAGMVLAMLAHAVGWPIPLGGTQAITDALAADVLAHGGRIRTGVEVTDLRDLPRGATVLLDVAPWSLVRLAGGRLPQGYVRAVRRYRHGGAAAPVHFALSGAVPWAAPALRGAGTLHLGGTREEMTATERTVARGRHAASPYVLVSQPTVHDPTRAPAGRHVLWTYAHVPFGSTRDAGDDVQRQVERFAPGFSDLVLARHAVTAHQVATDDPTMIGGDIACGAASAWQLAFRPVPRWDAYRVPLDDVWLCSAATSPGPGVHGMSGVNAARRVLRRRGIRVGPDGLSPG
jgi:phytoene dehydrogenase-like protein